MKKYRLQFAKAKSKILDRKNSSFIAILIFNEVV